MSRDTRYAPLPTDAPEKEAERPYFPFWARDWLSSVAIAAMTPEQEGGYLHLLALSWFENPPCSLVDDDAVLARLSRLGPRRWRNVGASIRAQFEPIEVLGSGARLRNSKLYSVYCDMIASRERRVSAGKKGGETTAARRHEGSNAGSNATSIGGSNESADEQHSDSDANADTNSDSDTDSTTRDTSTAIASQGVKSTSGEKRSKPRRRAREEKRDPRVDEVLEHYVSVHPLRRPGDKAATIVRRALETYSAEELIAAIDGNAGDAWHREKGKHELDYVLRDNEKIDSFRLRPAERDWANEVMTDENGFTPAYHEWTAAGCP